MQVIVFTSAFNAEKTIERTIRSILGQTFGDFEYYILDNAATDHTGEIIRRFAMMDQRIKFIRLNKNDPTNGGAVFNLLAMASNADYIVWCDADDTYSPLFLEKMTAFAQNNNLDIAACGYDMVDGISGALIKHRVSSENLLISGNGFTKKFIQYRGFMSYLWGKLYSIPFMKKFGRLETAPSHHLCVDTMGTMSFFQTAERVGIYSEAMYQYYQYPRSLKSVGVKNGIDSLKMLWQATKSYLESYGTISKLNEDFLYAIYLSLVDEMCGYVFAASLGTGEKLTLLYNVFSEPLWKETLLRKADPQFRNLAGRQEYVRQMEKRILSLATTTEEQYLAIETIRKLSNNNVCVDVALRE